MNVKDIIKNQSVRHLLLKLFAWLPDRVMLPLQYWLILRRKLDMKNPKRFSEKIQCYKAFYRNKEMLRCVDKFLVRDYVIEKLGTDKYLNKLYQVCDKAEDIDWESLPDKFVIKTTDGGNGDNVFICTDKTKIDNQKVVSLVNSWRNKKYYRVSREWAYLGAKESKIIVEEYLSQDKENELLDYKFFCFNGVVKFMKIDFDRSYKHGANYYDLEMNLLPFGENECPPNPNKKFDKPKNFHLMINLAQQLSKDFPFVRVDFYNINGAIYFGELTFYPGSGYTKFIPDSADFEWGKLFTYSFK